MKIIIAPDSFKESLTSLEVAKIIETAFKKAYPNAHFIKIPIADGGEGTVKALVQATNGKVADAYVTDPLGNKIKSFYGICGDTKTAVIEMASSSGLALVPTRKRNPLITTSYGTGELIKKALDDGYRKFIIGIGGSATNDAGAGMLQALGVKLLDESQKEIGFGGASLLELANIDTSLIDSRIINSQIEVACDVTNPLTGPNGASAVFGPQKGATPQMVKTLDKCLKNFATIVKKEFGQDINKEIGAGAAGGMGGSLKLFLNASLRPGIEIIMEQTKFKEIIKSANLVITGEGKMDKQSIYGKAPIGIAKIAHENKIPTIAIVGSTGEDAQIVREHGIKSYFSIINSPCTLREALKNTKENLRVTSENIAFTLKLTI